MNLQVQNAIELKFFIFKIRKYYQHVMRKIIQNAFEKLFETREPKMTPFKNPNNPLIIAQYLFIRKTNPKSNLYFIHLFLCMIECGCCSGGFTEVLNEIFFFKNFSIVEEINFKDT